MFRFRVFVLLVMIISAAFFMTACSQVSAIFATATPTLTSTPTYTPTPTATLTPIPTSTSTPLPTPTQMGGGSNVLRVVQSVFIEERMETSSKRWIYRYFSANYDLDGNKISPDMEVSEIEFFNTCESTGPEITSMDTDGYFFRMPDGTEEKVNSSVLNSRLLEENSTQIDENTLTSTFYGTIKISPDGQITYLVTGGYEENNGSIYLVDLEKETETLITQNADIYLYGDFTFSPDNQWVLFWGEDYEAIYLMATDGSVPPRELTGIKSMPLWSKFSPYLYWMGNTSNDGNFLHKIIRIDPKTLESEVLAEGYNLIGNYYVENDTKQCFESTRAAIFYCGAAAIDLTQDPPEISGYIEDMPLVTNIYAYILSHWYSPDGSKVVFRVAGKHDKFYVIDLDTGTSIKLNDFYLTAMNPWSPDGRLLVGMKTEYPRSIDEIGQDNRMTSLLIYDIDQQVIVSTIPIEADGELFPIWLK